MVPNETNMMLHAAHAARPPSATRCSNRQSGPHRVPALDAAAMAKAAAAARALKWRLLPLVVANFRLGALKHHGTVWEGAVRAAGGIDGLLKQETLVELHSTCASTARAEAGRQQTAQRSDMRAALHARKQPDHMYILCFGSRCMCTHLCLARVVLQQLHDGVAFKLLFAAGVETEDGGLAAAHAGQGIVPHAVPAGQVAAAVCSS